MKYFRARFLIAILCLIPASVVFAASEHYEKLYRESADFRAAEDALNDIWKKLKTELKGNDWKKLLTNQRDWLKKQAKMLETGADVNLYLAEACARALRLRDYHQSLMKDGEISGRIVEHKGGAALRTSQRLGAAECSHLYPLYPPVKIEEVSREARAGKNWTPALMNFYADNVVLAVEDFREPETTAKSSATEIAAKAAEDEKKTKAALAEATDEKKEVPARTQATSETENAETNQAAARIAETTPAKSADIAPEESDGTK
ncbi:MAG: hypothetical protein K2H64_00675, partial [Desulfovibrio sp.]|nr:hypothetical protein [Desulfovibrio sp.]